MNTLQAVIKLQEIKEMLNCKDISKKSCKTLTDEFILAKKTLLQSQFTFTPITTLIEEVERRLKAQ